MVSGDVNGEGSVKEEKMDYSEFLSKCNQNVPLPPNSEGLQAGPYNNKVINAEIKDILELLKQGSAKFVNCTFNFHFHQWFVAFIIYTLVKCTLSPLAWARAAKPECERV